MSVSACRVLVVMSWSLVVMLVSSCCVVVVKSWSLSLRRRLVLLCCCRHADMLCSWSLPSCRLPRSGVVVSWSLCGSVHMSKCVFKSRDRSVSRREGWRWGTGVTRATKAEHHNEGKPTKLFEVKSMSTLFHNEKCYESVLVHRFVNIF